MVGLGGLEPPTSPLSGARSSHLSYRPIQTWRQLFLLYRTRQILAILLSKLSLRVSPGFCRAVRAADAWLLLLSAEAKPPLLRAKHFRQISRVASSLTRQRPHRNPHPLQRLTHC